MNKINNLKNTKNELNLTRKNIFSEYVVSMINKNWFKWFKITKINYFLSNFIVLQLYNYISFVII